MTPILVMKTAVRRRLSRWVWCDYDLSFFLFRMSLFYSSLLGFNDLQILYFLLFTLPHSISATFSFLLNLLQVQTGLMVAHTGGCPGTLGRSVGHTVEESAFLAGQGQTSLASGPIDTGALATSYYSLLHSKVAYLQGGAIFRLRNVPFFATHCNSSRD